MTSPLDGKTLAMIFDKPSTRTRVSFDVGMRQLGGEAIMLTGQLKCSWGAAKPSPIPPGCSRAFVDAIMIRILNHEALDRACGSCDRACDQWTDTPLASLSGDGGRHDLRGTSRPDQGSHRGVDRRRQQRAGVVGACRGAVRASICASRRHRNWRRNKPTEGLDCKTNRRADHVLRHQGRGRWCADADCIVTDTWVSMGDKDGEHRHNLLKPYQVNGQA
jgi:ornithine carbamoyltransferase